MRRQSTFRSGSILTVLASVCVLFGTSGCSAGGEGSGEDESFGPPASDEPALGEFVPGEAEKDLCGTGFLPRTDYKGYVTLANGLWGFWATCMDACLPYTYAYGIKLDRDGDRGAGDDTALNGVALNCKSGSGSSKHVVMSDLGPFGDLGFSDNPQCPTGQWLRGGRLQFEAAQGSGDDTAANNVQGNCTDNTNLYPHPATNWGTMGAWAICPAGQVVCGLQTRVEWTQGAGDDTSLNGVRFACCTSP